MSSITDLMSQGEALGYADKELREWVSKQQAFERDERDKDRQIRRDREKELVELELEKNKAELEQRKLEKEMEQRKLDKQIELELSRVEANKEIELEKLKVEANAETGSLAGDLTGNPSGNSSGQFSKVRGPKLPYFDEAKDSIDAYIFRFERYAGLQNWREETWATNLSALLRGKALEVYSRLPIAQASDFGQLKAALLKRFDVTEEGLRKKVKESKPERGETFTQFGNRLRSYQDKWVELAEVDKDYESLMDFLMRDQFLQICGRELSLFLKERAIKSFDEMVRQADLFAEVRGGATSVVKGTSSQGHRAPLPSRVQGAHGGPPNVMNKGPVGNSVQCFYCHAIGHVARDCRTKARIESVGAGFTQGVEPGGSKDGMYRQGPPYRGGYQNGYQNRQGMNPTRGRGRGNDSFGRGYQNGGYAAGIVSVQEVDSENPDIGLIGGAAGGVSLAGMPVSRGQINDVEVDVLRDSGCSGVVVRRRLVKASQMLGRRVVCRLINGQSISVPLARVWIDSPYFSGDTVAWCLEDPICDVVVGNVQGASQCRFGTEPSEGVAQAVVTRAQKAKAGRPYPSLPVPQIEGSDVNPDRVRELQTSDESLETCRSSAVQETVKQFKNGGQARFVYKDGTLYREFESEQVVTQLVVPKALRMAVMKLAHDSIMSGHLGVKKTTDRVLVDFYWPGCCSDVVRYVRSCDICQRTTPKGRVPKVPLGRMPVIDVPHKRVAIDLIGPIFPVTDKGNRYILTMVDFATRYPEGVALPSIETERVAEALVDMFSRVGLPEEVLSDKGSQFTGNLMREVSRLLSIKRVTTTPFNPKCNGLCEKMNGTLKHMLRKMSAERPRDWDKYLSAVLFAYREVPQESLGFSPFELMFGRKVRGPMSVLRELWSKPIDDSEVKTTYQYVIDLKERLEDTCQLAQDSLRQASGRQRRYYDLKARDRQFKVGSRVLVLLPTNENKLLMRWKGPFMVEARKGDVDYVIRVRGKPKTFHANMLKQYYEREVELPQVSGLAAVFVDVVDEDGNDGGEEIVEKGEEISRALCPLESKESYRDVVLADRLTVEQKAEAMSLLEEFSDIFTDKPGSTNLLEMDIKLTTSEPVRSTRGYPLQMREQIVKEVEQMERLGVIEPSNSPYCSPLILVKKKSGETRTCVDLRALNRVTVFDAEPMPDVDSIFSRLGRSGKRFFSRLDLSKGYWQIPLVDSAREKTAFCSPTGLYQFTVMCFGLVTAPAVFSRMMRMLLQGLDDVDNFIDDIMSCSEEWEEHLKLLRELFVRIRNAKLTVRPTKCAIGEANLECLGHMIGEQGISMVPEKVQAVVKAQRPMTKRQVRAFLGLAGYYRKFIEHFASIAVPLTDLTKKAQPNKVIWGEAEEAAFRQLQDAIASEPVLQGVDLTKPFLLQTDASDFGLGAVLLQEGKVDPQVPHPVAYASRKLNQRERNYSTIERECLAIVWGLHKFEKYLYGREFVLQTDHQPLTYLKSAKLANGRLMRWAMLLQPFRFRIEAIKGSQNVGADYLSRLG